MELCIGCGVIQWGVGLTVACVLSACFFMLEEASDSYSSCPLARPAVRLCPSLFCPPLSTSFFSSSSFYMYTLSPIIVLDTGIFWGLSIAASVSNWTLKLCLLFWILLPLSMFACWSLCFFQPYFPHRNLLFIFKGLTQALLLLESCLDCLYFRSPTLIPAVSKHSLLSSICLT